MFLNFSNRVGRWKNLKVSQQLLLQGVLIVGDLDILVTYAQQRMLLVTSVKSKGTLPSAAGEEHLQKDTLMQLCLDPHIFLYLLPPPPLLRIKMIDHRFYKYQLTRKAPMAW